MTDVQVMIFSLLGSVYAAPTAWVDLVGETPDFAINVLEMREFMYASLAGLYPYRTFSACPADQPSCGNWYVEGEEECDPPGTAGCDSFCRLVGTGDVVMEWVPVATTDPNPVFSGNDVMLSQDGVTVTLQLRVSRWEPNQTGYPVLGTFQATLDPVGLSSGAGNPLLPVEAILANKVCSLSISFSDADPLSWCASAADCSAPYSFCIDNEDYVLYAMGPASALLTSVPPNLMWGGYADFWGVADNGSSKHAGTLVVEVPLGASGTYTIGLDPRPNRTFLADDTATPFPGRTLVPARILLGPVPPTLPADPKHQARKHRYVSIDPSTNEPQPVAIQIELTSMTRCAGLLEWSAHVPGDCPLGTTPVVEHPDVNTVWWVGAPNSDGVSLVVDTPVYRNWTRNLIHIGDCEIIPVATYTVRATRNGVDFSGPLEIETIRKPLIAPGAYGHYGDVAGAVDPATSNFTEPDRVVSVIDISAYLFTAQNLGTPNLPQTPPTWVDLHGLGDGFPPNYIVNVSDLMFIKFGFAGQTWEETPGSLSPAQCP